MIRKVRSAISRRWKWYRHRFQMDNRLIGRLIEMRGNQVRLHGLKFSVDNPQISTPQKSTIYFGIYELGEIEFVKKYITADDAVIELGGSIGVVACITNSLLRTPRRHLVVEASPALIPTLKANRDLNGCDFRIEHCAIAYGTETVEFAATTHFLMGSLNGSGGQKVAVRASRLAPLIESLGVEQVKLVCDIEGAEEQIVANELAILQKHVKLMIMETHPQFTSEQSYRAMITALESSGFSIIDKSADVLVLLNTALAGTPGRGAN